MNKLGSSPSKLLLEIEGGVRKISRDVGLGVVAALDEHRPAGEEPGWQAQQLALGFLRGLGGGVAAEDVRRPLDAAIAHVVQTALSAGLAGSAATQQIAEEAARAFTRGVVGELRVQLGEQGDGALTRSLRTSASRVVREGALAAAPLMLLAVLVLLGLAVGGGVVGALLLR